MTSFIGGAHGEWEIIRMASVKGPPFRAALRLVVQEGVTPSTPDAAWTLRGVKSHLRYTEGAEVAELKARQEGLGRATSTCAALIPITKSQAWWDLPQDERRSIFETRSRHISASLKYLPAIARQLYHCRDLGEPFDFLTWFEYAPKDAEAFEELVGGLRKTEEWEFVVREVDIRLRKTQ